MILAPYSVYDKLYPNATKSFNDSDGVFAVPDRHYKEIRKNLFIHRLNIWKGGRGSAKTHSAALAFIHKCLSVKFNLLIIRREYRLTLDTIFDFFKKVINESDYLRPLFTITGDKITAIKNGSEIIARGVVTAGKITYDKIKALKDIDAVWFDEIVTSGSGNEIDADTYDQILLSIGRNKGSKGVTLISFNPISKNKWVYKRYFKPKPENNPYLKDARIFETTYKDNPYLSTNYIEELESLKEKDPTLWEVVANGKWGTVEAKEKYYYGFDKYKQVKILADREPTQSEYVVFSFDFNLGIMACVVMYIDEIRKKCAVMYEFPRSKDINTRIQSIKSSRYAKYLQRAIITGDASKGGTVADGDFAHYTAIKVGLDIGNHQIKVATTNLTHKSSNLAINTFFVNWEVVVRPECGNVIEDFGATPTDNNFTRLKKIHDPHFGECVEYAVATLLYKFLNIRN